MRDIQRVAVIGATGTMGSNVAGLFASLGQADVYCIGRDLEKVRKTIPKIIRDAKNERIANRLIPADFSMLEKCVAESELVYEIVVEDIRIKREIAMRVGKALSPHAFSCTGTSGLSVTEIASAYPERLRGRLFGVHLFNPPHSLPLCEFIPTKFSDNVARVELREYLQHNLSRIVVEVKDSPAFIGNRIGFQFLNEALQFAKTFQDRGGVDYIDAILGPFSGRAMAPLQTADFVGLDVHQTIVDNLYENTADVARETFQLPEFAQTLIREKRFGRKSGGGLYRTVHDAFGNKQQQVWDIASEEYRTVVPYCFPFAETMKNAFSSGDHVQAFRTLVSDSSKEAGICRHFLLKYLVYSLYVGREVGSTIHAVDDVMAMGFHWCPPLALYQALSSVADVPELIKTMDAKLFELMPVEKLLSELEPSVYDYRKFFQG